VDDRRKYKRLRFGVIVEISYYQQEPKDREIINKTRTKDISAGGIRVSIRDKLDIDSLVSVKLTIPNTDREVTCFGQVAWVSPPGKGRYETGLAFMDLSEKEAALIEEFIEKEIDKGIE